MRNHDFSFPKPEEFREEDTMEGSSKKKLPWERQNTTPIARLASVTSSSPESREVKVHRKPVFTAIRRNFRSFLLFHEVYSAPLARRRHPYFKYNPWRPHAERQR